jgi:YD repeat-containing protein
VARPGRNAQVTVHVHEYGHDRSAQPDTDAPEPGGCRLAGTRPYGAEVWIEGASVSFLALSSSGPAAVLRPGQSETYAITARTPFAVGQHALQPVRLRRSGRCELSDPLDWAQLGEDLRPTDLPDEAWEPLLARLQAQIGTTWGDYLDVLRDNANHLAEIDLRVYDTSELFAFEFIQATAMGLPATMEAAQDAFAPSPGLPLSFERYFVPEPVRRARLGPLGRGWMHSYQIRLYERSDGSIAIHGPSIGFDRSFQPDGSGGYLAGAGDNATLTAQPGGEFLLTEKNGLQILLPFRRPVAVDAGLQYQPSDRSYDAEGRMVRSPTPAATISRFEYDSAGRLVQVIDHADRATHYAYDASGEHLLSVTGPDGEVDHYTYLTGAGPLLDHHLTSITRPGGLQIQFSYDDLGRLAGRSSCGR